MDSLATQLREAGIDCSTMSVLAAKTERPIFRLSMAGGTGALAEWKKMQSLSPRTGHWPIILGAPDDLRHRDFSELPKDEQVRETLAYADTIRVPEWFTSRHQERLDDLLECNEGEDPSGFFAAIGDWPEGVRPSTSLYTAFDSTSRKPHREVIVALVPTEIGWQAPAYLGFGNWNECPEAAAHCAVFKYWQERRGAQLAAITGDVVEAVVERPPTTRDDAAALAQEQYEYCADIVEQGTGTISRLAASLLNAPLWFFWWD